MTCIAWDGKTLAADKRMGASGAHASIRKIHRVHDFLVGGAGSSAEAAAMVAWLEMGGIAEDFPSTQRDGKACPSILVIRAGGQIEQYENTPHPILIESPFWAIGSGAHFALAALHLGKTAREAVEVACALDMNCGNGIDTLELE